MPDGFRPALAPLRAEFSAPPALRRHRYTGRRAEGVRYEAAVQAYLTDQYGPNYLAGPWIKFMDQGRLRWCQPDGLLFDCPRGSITIVEVKYQHTPDAWWQVRHLYGVVLASMFPADCWSFSACEVVKWYDPAISFPERVVLARTVDMATPFFKVHIWKP